MDFLYVAAGLALLYFGGDWLVRGAISLSLKLGLSAFLISMTVIGFGTSLPEMLVSIQAALAGAPGIALGNVVGSNIANVLLIVAIAALLFPISGKTEIRSRDLMVMVAVSALLVAVLHTGQITAIIGLAMLAMLGIYLFAAWKQDVNTAQNVALDAPVTTSVKTGFLLLAGFAMLMIGANLLVSGATAIAAQLGVSNAVIGLTVVAVGTSLPELATSVSAALRREPEIALGNVIGSNIFNILAILGATSLLADIPVADRFLQIDGWVMLASAVILTALLLAHIGIGRVAGLLMLTAYAAYIWTMV